MLFKVVSNFKCSITFLYLIGGFQSFEAIASVQQEELKQALLDPTFTRHTSYSANIAPDDLARRDDGTPINVVVESSRAATAVQEDHSADDDDVLVDPSLLVSVDTRDAEAALDKLATFTYYHLGGETRREIEAELQHVVRIDQHLLTEASTVIESGLFNTFFGNVLGKIRQLQEVAAKLQDQNARLRHNNEDTLRAWKRSLRDTRPTRAVAVQDTTVEGLQRETSALTTEVASLKATNTWLKLGWGSTTVTAVVGAVAVVIIWLYK